MEITITPWMMWALAGAFIGFAISMWINTNKTDSRKTKINCSIFFTLFLAACGGGMKVGFQYIDHLVAVEEQKTEAEQTRKIERQDKLAADQAENIAQIVEKQRILLNSLPKSWQTLVKYQNDKSLYPKSKEIALQKFLKSKPPPITLRQYDRLIAMFGRKIEALGGASQLSEFVSMEGEFE